MCSVPSYSPNKTVCSVSFVAKLGKKREITWMSFCLFFFFFCFDEGDSLCQRKCIRGGSAFRTFIKLPGNVDCMIYLLIRLFWLKGSSLGREGFALAGETIWTSYSDIAKNPAMAMFLLTYWVLGMFYFYTEELHSRCIRHKGTLFRGPFGLREYAVAALLFADDLLASPRTSTVYNSKRHRCTSSVG